MHTPYSGHSPDEVSHLNDSVSLFQPGGVSQFIPGRYSNFSPTISAFQLWKLFSFQKTNTSPSLPHFLHPPALPPPLLFFPFSLKHFIPPSIPCSIFYHCLISSFISGKCSVSPIPHVSLKYLCHSSCCLLRVDIVFVHISRLLEIKLPANLDHEKSRTKKAFDLVKSDPSWIS